MHGSIFFGYILIAIADWGLVCLSIYRLGWLFDRQVLPMVCRVLHKDNKSDVRNACQAVLRKVYDLIGEDMFTGTHQILLRELVT